MYAPVILTLGICVESEELRVQGHPWYVASLRPDWDTWNFVSKKTRQKRKNNQTLKTRN